MMSSISSPSTSTSASSSTVSTPKLQKCLVCFQPAHGNHFGVDCCRACAAFFRYFEFRWLCKRCRTDRCFALGMKPDNIQRDRDRFVCSEQFHEDRKRKSAELIFPLVPIHSSFDLNEKFVFQTVDRFVKNSNPTVRTYTLGSGKNYQHLTFFDLSQILSDAEYILRKTPKLNKSLRSKSSLEKLAFGLREVRKSQIMESIPEMRKIGKSETWNHWVNQMRRAGEWISHFEEFRELEHEEKMIILKSMWHLFARLERISMTAEMRRQKLCEDNDFVYGTEHRINYDRLEIERKWFSEASDQEVRYYIGPFQLFFGETIIHSLMELCPSDVEVTFMLCNLCFHLTGQKLGGRIQEITDRLQDVLANDLHKYYLENDKYSRYSHRLTKLLNLNRQYQVRMS
ncbi:hypothetical protein CRE_01448 [Caenorhabditis remanei]|uniref:Uncharacterized protein n=1 Tax=Caenorhabditis remanei TaxID=31234 RepID=E3NMP7_CAERE|nr:hypothetical protein CRE_01448 [Caenorhabditis remanei]